MHNIVNLMLTFLIFSALTVLDTCYEACDSGWVSGDVSCYFFSDDTVDNAIANTMCSEFEASLAKITSMEENDFITQHTSDTSRIANQYWIQGVATEIDDQYAFDDGQPITFFHWHSKQPNGGPGDCVKLIHDYHGTPLPDRQWNDYYCERTFHYICEKNKMDEVITEQYGHYTRYKSAGVPRVSAAIACGVACDQTPGCVSYTFNDDGQCVILETPCSTANKNTCYNRSQ